MCPVPSSSRHHPKPNNPASRYTHHPGRSADRKPAILAERMKPKRQLLLERERLPKQPEVRTRSPTSETKVGNALSFLLPGRLLSWVSRADSGGLIERRSSHLKVSLASLTKSH